MLKAVEKAYSVGKGIYSMKPLGGGNLIKSYKEAMDFVLNIPYIHSIAVGMQSIEEVVMNVCIFEGKEVPQDVQKSLENKKDIFILTGGAKAAENAWKDASRRL